LAQEEKNPTVGPELTTEAPADSTGTGSRSTGPRERTFVDSLKAGGYIGIIIILMSIVAVAFVIEHSISIRKQRLMPEGVLLELEDRIARGDIAGATQFCQEPQNYSLKINAMANVTDLLGVPADSNSQSLANLLPFIIDPDTGNMGGGDPPRA
jgi:hypothetical protein